MMMMMIIIIIIKWWILKTSKVNQDSFFLLN